MHARLVKETRSLLPVFAVVLLLITVPFTIWHRDAVGFSMGALILGCAALGAISFGNEFQHRTLPMLLSQPVKRATLWREKMLVVGTGILLCWMAFVAVVMIFNYLAPDLRQTWPLVLLILLCPFCIAPYLTLLLRSTIGGVVGSLVLPTLLVLVGSTALGWFFPTDEVGQENWVYLAILLCCPGVCWLGYSKFKHLEALDTPAQELSMPVGFEKMLVQPMQGISARFTSPFATLIKKELRLQQVNFLLAGIFCFVAVVGACAYLIKPQSEVPKVILMVDFVIYIVLIPLLVNVVAITEERAWGVADWQLTLPMSARKQWLAKMLVTHATGLTLGLVLPATLLLLGALLVSGGGWPSLPVGQFLFRAFFVVFAYLLLSNVAIHAASLSNSAVRGTLLTLGMMVAMGMMISSGVTTAYSIQSSAADPAFGTRSPDLFVYEVVLVSYFIVVTFILLYLLQRFSFLNYRYRHLNVRTILTQVLVVLVVTWLLSFFMRLPLWDVQMRSSAESNQHYIQVFKG